jgi:sugar phosphate isomerase/epimerase
MAAPLAAESGIVIAIEPLSKTECNLLNTVAEAKALAASVSHPNVSVVADIYHMAAAGETFDVLSDAGRAIAHVHVAQPGDRSHPRPNGYDWRPFMKALKSGGYDNRISIESMWSDFSAEAPDAVKVIRAAWEQA